MPSTERATTVASTIGSTEAANPKVRHKELDEQERIALLAAKIEKLQAALSAALLSRRHPLRLPAANLPLSLNAPPWPQNSQQAPTADSTGVISVFDPPEQPVNWWSGALVAGTVTLFVVAVAFAGPWGLASRLSPNTTDHVFVALLCVGVGEIAFAIGYAIWKKAHRR